MPNIEIKARYKDLDRGKQIASALKGQYVGRDHQVDTYFATRRGRLKLRESSLSGACLIPYLRPDQTGPKRSEYELLPISSPQATKQLLEPILGIDVVVDKQREIFLVGNVRVHLDSVKELGQFIEFEAVYEGSDPATQAAEQAKVERLMGEFGIRDEDLLTGSYRELLIERCPTRA